MKKKSLLALGAALATAAAVAAAASGGAAGPTKKAATLPTLRIGTVLPFTGFVGESAREMQKTFGMYIKQHGGKLGGLPVKVIYEDSETKPELDVTKTKKLIEQDKVHLLASAMLAFEGLAVVDTIAKAKIALVGETGVTADEYRKIRSPYLTAAAKHTPSQETFPLGTYAAKTLHYKKAAMICQDYTWGWETCGGWQYAFEQGGGKVVQKLWVPIGTTDYAPFVTQLKQDVDVVDSTLVGADVPRFVKAYADFGLMGKIPLMGSEDLIAADAYRYYSSNAAGITGITPFTTALARPEMQRFVSDYKAISGGKNPTFWGEASYVAAMIIDRTLQKLEAQGIPKAQIPDYVRSHATTFINTVRKINLSDTPSSPVTVDKYNFAIRNFYLVKLVKKSDGKIGEQLVKTFPHVSQFWIFPPAQIFKLPLFSRTFPKVSG
jgi:branched-chain amino acid transport system substrate-binding protein